MFDSFNSTIALTVMFCFCSSDKVLTAASRPLMFALAKKVFALPFGDQLRFELVVEESDVLSGFVSEGKNKVSRFLQRKSLLDSRLRALFEQRARHSLRSLT